MIDAGIIFELRGKNGNANGFVYKQFAARRYKYIPMHQMRKYEKLFKNSQQRVVISIGLTAAVLNSRLELSKELSDLIWFLLTNWYSPPIVYEASKMSQEEIQGLENGAEAFILSSSKYTDTARSILSAVQALDPTITTEGLKKNLNIKKLIA